MNLKRYFLKISGFLKNIYFVLKIKSLCLYMHFDKYSNNYIKII